MMYYFCNFMETKIKGYKKALNFINISNVLDENVQQAKCFKISKEGVQGLEFIASSEESTGVEMDFLGSMSCEKVGATEEELASTNENPIIVVATKKFKIYENIPSYIKYFPVQGGVIVALIKGYISVESKDGEMIPLSRNCDVMSSDNGVVLTADDIKKLNVLKDVSSGLSYSDLVVSDCIISYTVNSKDGSKYKSIKFSKENFVILNEEVFEEARLAKEARERVLQEERERKAIEMAKFNKIYREKLKDEEKNKEKSSSKPKRTSKKDEEPVTTVTGSKGAQAFLNCIANL